jgi:hypothetical protein
LFINTARTFFIPIRAKSSSISRALQNGALTSTVCSRTLTGNTSPSRSTWTPLTSSTD